MGADKPKGHSMPTSFTSFYTSEHFLQTAMGDSNLVESTGLLQRGGGQKEGTGQSVDSSEEMKILL